MNEFFEISIRSTVIFIEDQEIVLDNSGYIVDLRTGEILDKNDFTHDCEDTVIAQDFETAEEKYIADLDLLNNASIRKFFIYSLKINNTNAENLA